MDKNKGFVALIATALTYSTFGILIRTLGQYFGNFTQVAVRFALAALILIFISFFRRTPIKLNLKQADIKWFLIFILAFPLAVMFFTGSVMSTKASNAFFYLYATGLINGIILGKWLFKEKITVIKLLSIILATIGLFIFAYPLNIFKLATGLVLGLLSGIGDSTTNAMRKILGTYDRNSLLTYQYTTGFILAALIAVVSQEALLQSLDFKVILTAILFGTGLVVVGSLALYGFKNFDLNIGTVVVSSEMFFALLINAYILKEFPTLNEIYGGILIFLAVVIINLSLRSRVKYRNSTQ